MGATELITRLVSLLFVGLSFVGWILFIAGCSTYIEEQKKRDESFDPGAEPSLYAFWAVCVIGPIVHILAVVHALLVPDVIRRVSGSDSSCVHAAPGSIVGSITAVLFVMYLSAIGFGVILTGILIAVDYSNFDYDATFALIFSGGVLTVVFWTVHLAFWPWFKRTSAHNRNTAANIETMALEAHN